MVKQLEAEPLSLPEHQRVTITVTDSPAAAPYNSRKAEMEWLDAHGDE
jgi:hypothetical protein